MGGKERELIRKTAIVGEHTVGKMTMETMRTPGEHLREEPQEMALGEDPR